MRNSPSFSHPVMTSPSSNPIARAHVGGQEHAALGPQHHEIADGAIRQGFRFGSNLPLPCATS